jgi:glycosyltransferase involved in cell wall biosynthesis
MIPVLLLIRSLNPGGAERQLVELVRGMDKERFRVTVATFYDDGTMRPEIETLPDVQIVSLGKSGRWDLPMFLHRLDRLVKTTRPSVIYSFLEVPNLFALWAGKRNHCRVVWGIRTAYIDFSQYDWTARAVYRLGAVCSRFADVLVMNSWAAQEYHPAHGYAKRNIAVVPNGIDAARYHSDSLARTRLRAEWGADPDEVLIGTVGRLDPIKDYPTFLNAAKILSDRHSNVRFVCVGGGTTAYQAQLRELTETLGLAGRVIWTGSRQDTAAIYSALDIFTSTSYGEAFPNVIGEAMASGLPVVATDVGDSARVVGTAGVVVPPRDPGTVSSAWERLLELPAQERATLGCAARQRIETDFSVEQMVSRTEDILARLGHE